MMDCDTTGIEPDIALVKYKQLVGGGMLKIVNRTVPAALAKRGYTPAEIEAIVAYIDDHDTIEGAPGLKDEHLPIFDCAFTSAHGTRSIHYMGHIRMMAAAQPFLSGGISKTVNLPKDATIEDIEEAYTEGWRLGLKSLAVYRDGSKRTQPLKTKTDDAAKAAPAPVEAAPRRRKLPDVRDAKTHKFSIAGHDGYLTVGLYEDGTPGEMFLKMSKEGSTVSGLVDTIAVMTSLSLQYGVPLKALVDKFSHTRFEPSGFTPNPEIPYAKSVTDYVFRWLGLNFPVGEAAAEVEDELSDSLILDPPAPAMRPTGTERVVPIRGGSATEPRREAASLGGQEDAPPCHNCGAIMVRAGACYACSSCGETGGCG
jgi:ribonucleoside-diphosphate reductase alpha chain